MNKKILAIGMLLILAAAIIWLGIFSKGNYKTLGSRGSSPVSNDAKNQSVANWVSQARTVDQLMVEADLVVKARVSEAPKTRIVRNEISMVDEKGAEIGKKVDEIAFSDTNFEVMEVYFGNASPNITVMQTGGFLNSPDERIEMQDDPLYNRGEEYILFLVNISGTLYKRPIESYIV